jgi:cell wall-associated NlpC family hydrolase/peptidoglycan hydrolase CwlO-like protein
MPRRVSLVVFLGVIATVVLVVGIPAGAAPQGGIESKRAEVSEAQERLMQVRMEASASYESYNNALFKLNRLDEEIKGTEEDLGSAQERLEGAQADLQERAAQVYKSGNVAFIDVLVGADDFSEFASRLELWVRLLGEERARVQAVMDAKAELQAEKNELEDQRESRAAALEEAAARKESSEAAEAEAEGYLGSLNTELAQAVQAEEQHQAEQARLAAERAASKQAAETVSLQTAAHVSQTVTPQVDPQALQEARERAAAAAEARERAQLLARQAEARQVLADRAAAQRQEDAERAAAAKEARRQARLAAVEEAAAQRAAEQAAAQQAAEERAAAAKEARQQARQAAREQAAQEAAEQQAAEEQAVQEEAAAPAQAQSEPSEEQYAEPEPSSEEEVSDDSGSSGSGSGGGSSGGSGSSVVAEAETWLGVPYVYGGSSRDGVDCSGLTMRVFEVFGISLPHSAAGQYEYGVQGSGAAGDLVFGDYEGGGSITHVGIATGDGQMINAPYPGTVVRHDPILDEYFVGYKDLL